MDDLKDAWSRWLLRERFAGDPEVQRFWERTRENTPPRNWKAILNTPPFSGTSPLMRVLETFSAQDRDRFEHCVRPQVEAGGIGRMRGGDAYLIAGK